MSNNSYVYWIHLKEHDDPYKQGYVGVSKNVVKRLEQHKSKKQNPLLTNIFKKHNDVEVDILFIGDTSFCFEVEHQYRPGKEIGWNINEGGISPPNAKGLKRSESTKKLISENNVGFRGKTHSDETKRKMSESRKKNGGTPHSEETKKKLSEIGKLRTFNPMRGRKHSEETRRLISQKMRKHTQNTKGEVNEQHDPI